MKTQRTHLFTLAGTLLLAGCGFHSVYGSHEGSDSAPVAEELHKVAIDPIPERAGQMLRNDLIDRVYGNGRPQSPAYHLSIALNMTGEDIGTLANATTALSVIHANATYALKDANDNILTKGSVVSTASYDKLESQYASLAASEGATERTLNEVSEQLTARLGLYFSERSVSPPPAALPKPPAK